MGNLLDCSVHDSVKTDQISTRQPNEVDNQGSLVVQGKKPIIESCLWDIQRGYFENDYCIQGPTKNCISSNSSNNYVANQYASVIINYILDWYSDPDHINEGPVYVVDIGSGYGKMGFSILNRLFELKEFWPTSPKIPFIFVLTDCNRSLLNIWKNDPLISQFIEMGYMDYAIFNIETDTSVTLLHSHVELSPSSIKTPPFFVCNDVFSTLPQDVVMVEGGQLKRASLTILQPRMNCPDIATAGTIADRYECCYLYDIILSSGTVYSWDEDLHDVMADVVKDIEKGIIVLPVVGIRFIRRMLSWYNNKAVFLIADEGIFSPSEISIVKDPSITVHGAVTIPVNFSILQQYALKHAGWMSCSTLNESFRACLLVLGISKTDVSRMNLSYRNTIQSFSPNSYYQLVKSIKDESSLSLRGVLCLLRLSRFDPDLFYRYKQLIIESCNMDMNTVLNRDDLHIDLCHIRDNVMYMNSSRDICFELARIHMGLCEYDIALDLFQDSNQYIDSHHITWHNMGICCFYLGEYGKAKQCFAKSLELKPTYLESQMWLQQISRGNYQVVSLIAKDVRRQERSNQLQLQKDDEDMMGKDRPAIRENYQQTTSEERVNVQEIRENCTGSNEDGDGRTKEEENAVSMSSDEEIVISEATSVISEETSAICDSIEQTEKSDINDRKEYGTINTVIHRIIHKQSNTKKSKKTNIAFSDDDEEVIVLPTSVKN